MHASGCLTCQSICGGEDGTVHCFLVAAMMVPVSSSGLEGGQQDALSPAAWSSFFLQVQRVCDVSGNQDIYRVPAAGWEG